MNLLLDTHTFLWAVFSPSKLSAKVRKVIASPEHQVNLSTISFWEISLKFGLGKITLENCLPEDLPSIALEMGLEIIQPTAQETASSYQLPKLLHRDPFDRLIVWQALQRSLIFVSKDAELERYKEFGLALIW